MKWLKRCSIVGMSLLLSLNLASCGSSGGHLTMESMGSEGIVANKYSDSMYTYDSISESNEVYESDYDDGIMPINEVVSQNKKLITTVSIDAETKEYDTAVNSILEKLEFCGGYAENADMYSNNNTSRHGSWVFRVPETKSDEFLDYVNGNCNVTWSSVREEDVTLSYTDIESHKLALQTEQTRLLELLEQAENLEDILSIEDRLTNIRYQLESYESQLRLYDNQIEYTTINFSLNEVVVLSEPEPEGWFERAGKGIVENFNGVIMFFQELGLGIVINLPSLIALGLVVVIIILIVLKSTKKSRQRNKEMRAMLVQQQQIVNQNSEESHE